MSINSEALEDLAQENNIPEAKNITVLATDAELKKPPTDAVIDQLQTANVEIKTVVDDVAKIHDLEAVSDIILATETISQSDVQDLDRKIGNVLSPELTINQFTEAPTKVGVSAVMKLVNERKTTLQASVLERTKNFIRSQVDGLLSIRERINSQMMPDLLAILDRLQPQAQALSNEVGSSRAFLAYVDRSSEKPLAVDYSKKTLTTGFYMNESTIPEEVQVPPELIRDFHSAFDHDTIKNYISLLHVSWRGGVLDMLFRPYVGHGPEYFTFQSLLAFYANTNNAEQLRQIHETWVQKFSKITSATAILNKENVEDKDLLKSEVIHGLFEAVDDTAQMYHFLAHYGEFIGKSVEVIDAFTRILRHDA